MTTAAPEAKLFSSPGPLAFLGELGSWLRPSGLPTAAILEGG
jgi:hypothetical protein